MPLIPIIILAITFIFLRMASKYLQSKTQSKVLRGVIIIADATVSLCVAFYLNSTLLEIFIAILIDTLVNYQFPIKKLKGEAV